MRDKIRSWLGIKELENALKEVKKFKNGTLTPEDILVLRRMIGEAVEAAFNGEIDNEWYPYIARLKEKNILQTALENAARPVATQAAETTVKARIDNEAFIDEIVARIQRKQLMS